MGRTSKRSDDGHQLRKGLTLLELMASITILLALFGLMLPVMSSARRTTEVSECLNNLRGIAITATFYSKDNDPTGRGSIPAQPWYLEIPGISPSYFSEYVYGGFRTTIDNPHFPSSDAFLIPTELRPYNKYIAPGIGGRVPIRNYICPADGWCGAPLYGEPGSAPDIEDRFSSWEVNGNSYALNWYWVMALEGWGLNPDGVMADLNCLSLYGSAMLQKKVGGAASEFVLFMEGCMNSYMYDARPPDGSMGESQLQMWGVGWHGKLSMYSMGFYDGHAEYRRIDTRYSSGAGYDIWPEGDTPWPAACP
jgi:type II secretory pathway pseudopilin PulG